LELRLGGGEDATLREVERALNKILDTLDAGAEGAALKLLVPLQERGVGGRERRLNVGAKSREVVRGRSGRWAHNQSRCRLEGSRGRRKRKQANRKVVARSLYESSYP